MKNKVFVTLCMTLCILHDCFFPFGVASFSDNTRGYLSRSRSSRKTQLQRSRSRGLGWNVSRLIHFLHVFHGGNLTGVNYQNELFYQYLRPYTTVINKDTILMDNNARSHRPVLLYCYLESHRFERVG